MSRGREAKKKEVDVEERDGDGFDEEDEVLEEIDEIRPDKMRRCDNNSYFDNHNWTMVSSSSRGGLDLNLNMNIEPQDADYDSNPSNLGEELGAISLPIIPIEVETMILARIPLLEIRRFCLLNKPILNLIRNGDLIRERKEIGVREASVFMFASGETNWWAFDQRFASRKTLPELPSDIAFKGSDKESLCAGTHLLVFGKEALGPVIWTYELLLNKWVKGSSMIEPRCLFASASSGDIAYVAGGTCLSKFETLNSAEKYDIDTKTWEPLPKMKEKRSMCSGVYMDDKFYVIGGQRSLGENLTCAEVFYEDKNTWVIIPGFLTDLTTSASPPLIAVSNNELYMFETSTNRLMVYLKDTNLWKELGPIPVRADASKGWGVAFKSLGSKLLAIGGSSASPGGRGMSVYTCCPNPNAEVVEWRLVDDGRNSRSAFVMNCTVMRA